MYGLWARASSYTHCIQTKMDSSPCKCVNLQKVGYESADLRKVSITYIWLSLWTGTGPSVHVPDTKALLQEQAHLNPGRSPFNTGVRHLPRGPHGAQWKGSGGKSRFLSSSPFCPIKRGGARKTSSANLFFWNSFLIKYFGFAKPMNCWLTQTSEELKFKRAWASWWLLFPSRAACALRKSPCETMGDSVSPADLLSPPPRRLGWQVLTHTQGAHAQTPDTSDSKYELKYFPKLSTL